MAGTGRQLVLPFPINQRCVFANFQIGDNRELLDRLQDMPTESGFNGLWIWGGAGAGVSHLLQASCQRYTESGRQVAYLPLAHLGRDPEILAGMDAYDLVALDDAKSWAGDPGLEAALVGLYQSLLVRNRALLVGAAAPVAISGFGLADLASRFAGLGAYQVQPLDDPGKAQLLRRLAGDRGLELGDPVLRFWLSRGDRALGRLLDQLDEVDAAAMSAQRTVTIPLLKQVLGL
jgi:DnaA family protein